MKTFALILAALVLVWAILALLPRQSNFSPENPMRRSSDLGIRAVREVLRLLEQYDAFDRVVLASFHEEIYDEFQRLQANGEVPENFMYSPAYDTTTAFFILQLTRLDLFFPDNMCVFQLLTEEMGFNLAAKHFVQTAQAHNLAVHYWTINDPAQMEHLISIGADGIMTDYPHRLKQVYDAYGE